MGVGSMNSYLAEFLTMGLDKHLICILNFFFESGAGFLSNLLFFFFGLVLLAIVFVFPLVISKIVVKIEEEHPKYAVIIDIVFILVVALVMMSSLNMYSGMRQGLSSEGAFYGSPFRGLVYYREHIGRLCGVVYSVLINNGLLKKYFVKLKIEKYQKPIFAALLVIWLFMVYYFYYLCQFLSA